MSIDKVLNERGSRYGDFSDVATVSQDLQHVLFCAADQKLADDQREAIQMICSKLARIVCGDHNYVDSWTDIAGYATLVEKRLLGSQNDEWPSDERIDTIGQNGNEGEHYKRKEYRDLEKPETWKRGDVVKLYEGVATTYVELDSVAPDFGLLYWVDQKDVMKSFKIPAHIRSVQSVEARSKGGN